MSKSKSGITLIALVITIIILLILAGISISMLSGENSILKRAGEAKTTTDIANEKEIISIAVNGSMGKSNPGNIDETEFITELENNNATVTKSGNKYKVAFTSGRQYIVDKNGKIKEKNPNPNVLEISELYENASTYFGWDVINYANTLPEELQDIEWQLFYAGAIEGQKEERIYLIAKDCIKNAQIPTVVKNGSQIEGARPIAETDAEYSDYAVFIGMGSGQTASGAIPYYASSNDITNENLQNLNRKYYTWLKENNTQSTNFNIRAVAYMLDSVTWGDYANEYAEYSVGGPTLELLFSSYNKYKNKNYLTQVTDVYGYKYDCERGGSFDNWNGYSMNNLNIRNPFVALKSYWIASCGSKEGTSPGSNILVVQSNSNNNYSGRIWIKNFKESGAHAGFRPLICLKADYSLEKIENDTFRIVKY